MLHLNDVTLIGIEGVENKIPSFLNALNVCKSYCSFDDIKILSPFDIKDGIKIERLNSVKEYCIFVLKKLNNYIDTKYCILFQHDGFILNPNAWSNEFYSYDYIGAPWPFLGDKVGNGGFSFRSKKLLEVCQKEDLINPEIEDLCIGHYNDMSKYGINIAPSNIGYKFSTENSTGNIIYYNSFGFHDFKTDLSYWKDKDKFGY